MNTETHRVMVGFFEVPGFGADSVETVCGGNPKLEYAKLLKALRVKHPLVDPRTCSRVGSVIEVREGDNLAGYIELTPGLTIGGVFWDLPPGSSHREIGRVFFDSRPMKVCLVNYPANGEVRLRLNPILRGDAPIPFAARFQSQRPAVEIEQLVREALGASAKGLRLNIRKAVAK